LTYELALAGCVRGRAVKAVPADCLVQGCGELRTLAEPAVGG
jgi:hypothetical protein